MAKKYCVCLAIAMAFLCISCRSGNLNATPGATLNLPDLPEEEGKTWLEIDPKQCGSNPWEQDNRAPEKCADQCEQADLQSKADCTTQCLVQAYYQSQGIDIFAVKTSSYKAKFGREVMICLSCDCPGGETIYVQIPVAASSKMLALRFRSVVRSCDTATPKPYGCP
jgi:hypothetical protein